MAFYEWSGPFEDVRLRDERGRFTCDACRGYSYGAHWHNDIELTLIARGDIEMQIEGARRTMHTGEIAICEGGKMHSGTSLSEDSLAIICIFNASYIKELGIVPKFTHTFLGAQEIEALGMPQEILGEVRACFERICAERTNRDALHQQIAEKYLNILVGYLSRYIAERDDLGAVRDSTSFIMQQVTAYIDENHMHAISLEQLGQKFSTSPFYLSRLFKMQTRKTFKEYLVDVRVMKAKIMLSNTEEQIIAVAMNCGFESIRTFNRVFKSRVGITPTEYRQKIRTY